MANAPTTLTVRDSIPKIGGSTAGFIALIVCLTVIILISSSVIVYILREECTLGRFTRRRRRRHERSTSSFAFIYDESSERRPQSWTKKLARFFRRRSATADSSSRGLSGAIPMRDGRGWYRTGSDGIWDHTVPQLTEVHNPLSAEFRVFATPHTSTSPPDAREHRGSLYHNNSSASSDVRFDLPDSRKMLQESSPVLLQSKAYLPSLHSGFASADFPLMPPANSPIPAFANSSSLRSGSPMPRPTVSPAPLAPESISPVGSPVRTFEGGSKFLEAL